MTVTMICHLWLVAVHLVKGDVVKSVFGDGEIGEECVW